MTALRWSPAALLLVAALAGCGDDADEKPTSSLSADEQKAADNLASQIVRSGSMSQQESSQGGVTEQQATCVAEGAVTEIGLAELQQYGIVTEDLRVNRSIQGVEMNAADADALASVFVDCVDAEALFEERFLTAMPADGAEEELRTCVQEAVEPGAVQEVLAASFQGRATDAYAKMQKDVSSCSGGKGSGQ
jgi:hypothetical protein